MQEPNSFKRGGDGGAGAGSVGWAGGGVRRRRRRRARKMSSSAAGSTTAGRDVRHDGIHDDLHGSRSSATGLPGQHADPFQIFPSTELRARRADRPGETSGNCNLLNYDVKGNSATVPNPDPYLMDRTTPACVLSSSTSPTRPAIRSPRRGPSHARRRWTFKLLPDKTAGGRGAGAAGRHGDRAPHRRQRTSTGAESATPTAPTAGMDTFFRLTQP